MSLLGFLETELRRIGWTDVHAGVHMDEPFDLIGSRRFLITQWWILVKMLPTLGAAERDHWQAVFRKISDRSKAPQIGQCFLLCLVAAEISIDVIEGMSGDDFGMFGIFRKEGGGGNVIIASSNSKKVYGKVPLLPYDVRKYTQETKALLAKALELAEPATPAAIVPAGSLTAPEPKAGAGHSVFISYSRKDEREKAFDVLVIGPSAPICASRRGRSRRRR